MTATPDVDLLLLSNSTNHGAGYLTHAREAIREVVRGRPIVFVPFALDNWDDYTAMVRAALPGLDVVGAHEDGAISTTIGEASCVFVGGGNTFRLLAALRRLRVVDRLAARVLAGACAYIGSSAGTNVAGPTIRTTNDMPIVDVGSLEALGLVPFQINPHYTDAVTPGLMAESRAERIAQFHERSDVPVVGLLEGSWVRVDGDARPVGGTCGAKVFERGAVTDLAPGDPLDRWWHPGTFDDREPLDVWDPPDDRSRLGQ